MSSKKEEKWSNYFDFSVLKANPEFLSTLLEFLTWCALTGVVDYLTRNHPIIGKSLVPFLLIIATTWAYRSRHNYGMRRIRAHFDEIDLLQLPPRSGQVWECCGEPPTPVEPTTGELLYMGHDPESFKFMKALTKALDDKGGPTPHHKTTFEQKRQSHYDNMFTYAMEQNKLLREQQNQQRQKTSAKDIDETDDFVLVDAKDIDDLQSAKEDFEEVNI